jgi:signal transduction histidine kinase
MPGISQRRFHSTIRGPSVEALGTLAAHSDEIFAIWHRAVSALGLDPNDLLTGTSPDFAQLADRLRKITYLAFRQEIQEFGGRLANRGVKLDHAVGALNRLFEIGLSHLTQSVSKRTSPALLRLQALAGLLIVSGYTGQWAAGKKTPVEESLPKGEDRRHEASAYVTRIYEQERRRFSQDLHDEVGNDLVLIKLCLEMIALNGDTELGARQARLAEAIALVSHAIDAVRRLVLDLGPAILEDLGFLPALRSYISQFSMQTKINVTLRAGHLPTEIPSSHQVALYRLLQGALSNVLKHASAKNVKVSLKSMKDSGLIMMIVEDDGVGFDTGAKPRRRSFGLTAMRERVEVLGGRIHLQSKLAAPAAKGHGTRIEIDLPLPG